MKIRGLLILLSVFALPAFAKSNSGKRYHQWINNYRIRSDKYETRKIRYQR